MATLPTGTTTDARVFQLCALDNLSFRFSSFPCTRLTLPILLLLLSFRHHLTLTAPVLIFAFEYPSILTPYPVRPATERRVFTFGTGILDQGAPLLDHLLHHFFLHIFASTYPASTPSTPSSCVAS